jgi:hypothetical protein
MNFGGSKYTDEHCQVPMVVVQLNVNDPDDHVRPPVHSIFHLMIMSVLPCL